jgi:thiol-disulfide isomerase/thioredoxin
MKLLATFLWSVVAFIAATFAAKQVVIWQGAGLAGGNVQGFAVWTVIMAGALGVVMTGYAWLTARWFAVSAHAVALMVGALAAEFGTYGAWLILGTWLNAAGVPPIFCWVPAGACAGVVATAWWRRRRRKPAAAPEVGTASAGRMAPRRLLIVLSALAVMCVGLLGWRAHEGIIARWTENFEVLRPVPEAPLAGPLQQMYADTRFQIATSNDLNRLGSAEALLLAFAQANPPAESLGRVTSSYIYELNRLDRATAVAWVDRMLASPYPGIAVTAQNWKRNWTAGDTPIELKFTAIDGREVDLAQLRGKVVLVDFWATWCGPCIRELPNVKEAYRRYHERGFEVIGISLDHAKAREAVLKFVKVAELPWPQYYDGKGWANTWASAFAINSIPAAWLIDQNGRVVDKNARGEQLESEVKRMLGL